MRERERERERERYRESVREREIERGGMYKLRYAVDVRFNLSRLIGTRECPAHVTGCIPDVTTYGTVASLLVVVQSLDHDVSHWGMVRWV